MKSYLSFKTIILYLLIISPTYAISPQYRIVDLGKDSATVSVSDNGLILELIDSYFALRTPNGTIENLNALWGVSFAPEAPIALGVNNAGTVLGEILLQSFIDDFSFFVFHTFIGEKDSFIDLNNLTDPQTMGSLVLSTSPRKMNNQGQVVGIYNLFVPANVIAQISSTHLRKGFIGNAQGITDISTVLPLGDNHVSSIVINDKGQFAGTFFPNTIETNEQINATTQLFISNPTDSTKIVLLPISDIVSESKVIGVDDLNNQGQIIGTIVNTSDNQMATSFIGDIQSGITLLAPPLNSKGMTLDGINDLGQIVGSFQLESTDNPDQGPITRAFLRNANGQTYDLNNLITGENSYTIQNAVGVDNSGQIAANGTDSNGNLHALLLLPISSDSECITSNPSFMESADTGGKFIPNNTNSIPILSTFQVDNQANLNAGLEMLTPHLMEDQGLISQNPATNQIPDCS
ncbi:hypothetical protein [Candidatus Nitrosacidococcus tergens]|nr:hypothetical protein [Candidatus Nitrosacidococcus tergens]